LEVEKNGVTLPWWRPCS